MDFQPAGMGRAWDFSQPADPRARAFSLLEKNVVSHISHMKPKPAHKPAHKHHKKKMEPAVTRLQAHFRGRRKGRREAWARRHITTRSTHKSYLTRVERAITGDA